MQKIESMSGSTLRRADADMAGQGSMKEGLSWLHSQENVKGHGTRPAVEGLVEFAGCCAR